MSIPEVIEQLKQKSEINDRETAIDIVKKGGVE